MNPLLRLWLIFLACFAGGTVLARLVLRLKLSTLRDVMTARAQRTMVAWVLGIAPLAIGGVVFWFWSKGWAVVVGCSYEVLAICTLVMLMEPNFDEDEEEER